MARKFRYRTVHGWEPCSYASVLPGGVLHAQHYDEYDETKPVSYPVPVRELWLPPGAWFELELYNEEEA